MKATNLSLGESPTPLAIHESETDQKDSGPQVLPFDATLLAGQLAPSSIAMYERDFRAYLAFSGKIEQALLPATLARWRAHLAQETKMSPNTINRMISAVKRLIKEAATQGYLNHEVASAFSQISGVKNVALKERIKDNARVRIEPEDMRRLCETPDKSTMIGLRDAALLATLAGSGLRVSELASLKLSHIHRQEGGFLITVRGKNDVEFRDAPLSSTAHAQIQIWVDQRPLPSAFVFTAFDGRGARPTARPLSSVAIWRIVRKYSVEAGLVDVKPHDFRRFVGTQLARKDIRKAQKALGHKRLETTARHYVLDDLEAGLTDDLY
jgi:site-specific recombinase XerD